MQEEQVMQEIIKTTAKNLHLMMLNIAEHIDHLEEENEKLKSQIKELQEQNK